MGMAASASAATAAPLSGSKAARMAARGCGAADNAPEDKGTQQINGEQGHLIAAEHDGARHDAGGDAP